LEKKEYLFERSFNPSLLTNVKNFFINKTPKKMDVTYRIYSETFSGFVMDDYYSYPKIIKDTITDFNLIGITMTLTIAGNYIYSMHKLEYEELVNFTIYASKKSMMLIKLNSKVFEEEYLTKFNSVL
jgi:hypothetical protein